MYRATSTEARLLLACLLGLAAAGSAWALKTDKNKPINVNADHGDFRSDPKNNNNGTGIYTGHVVITQGSIVLTADRAVLHVVNNELDTADVKGNPGTPATFVQQPDDGQPMHGEAQEITYDASKNEVVLTTDAKLTQEVMETTSTGRARKGTPGERLMTADRIHYNTDTQRVIAKALDDQQRVHISFPPKVQVPASATAAAPPDATDEAPSDDTNDDDGSPP